MSKIKITDNKLVIHDVPHPVRLLIGAPFFIVGGYFFYHLVDALHDYIYDANADEWIAALPGMFIMLILGLAISLPGLFLAARESLVINLDLGVIGKRRELLGLHTRGKVIKLEDVSKILCRQITRKHIDRKVGSTSGRTTSVTSYLIDLEMKDAQQAALIEYTEKSIAKKTAKTLTEFAGIPLNDRL